MKKKYRSKKYTHRKKSNQKAETTRLGNQFSFSLILGVFIILIAFTDNSVSVSLREKTSAIISENILNNFERKDNIKDNISEFVRCMFYEEKETTKTATPSNNNIPSESQKVPEEKVSLDSEKAEIDTEPE